MRRLVMIAVMSAMVLAKPKPETYKETEDFQYSRSSSDDGTKSGFYGAQRGNMGGNYERAHNMDTLAQHQMSGLVRQVDGELGDGAKTRTGSVSTAANSRGIYGSGNYDLSNLQGRNFAEGESIGNLQSHSSLSSHNSRYRGHTYSGMDSSAGISSSHTQDARYSGYQTSRHADQRQIDNLQTVDSSQGLGRYESNNQADYNVKYHTQFGSRGRSEVDQSSANFRNSNGFDANSQSHYITTPVRVVMRPGGRVAIPITAPTYAVSQNFLTEKNDMNSDAEVVNQQMGQTPQNKAKHYEASYSYRKQWEKHHAIPGDALVVVPTENLFPKNSELYEDAELLQSSKNQFQNANSQRLHSSNANSDHTAYAKSASSRSRFQSGYNSQQSLSGFESQQNHAGFNTQQSESDLNSHLSQAGLDSQNAQQSHLGFNSQQSRISSGTRANSYGHTRQTSGMAADMISGVQDVNSKPKSYQSSYSYHKSWERQGDPYVIKPVGPVYDGQTSERLTAASSNSAARSSHQYASHSRQGHQSYSADCDDQGHVRVARSYNTHQELEPSQTQWEGLGQETLGKLENLEDLGQQTQNKWDNLQDLGQQTQNKWDNLQDLGQQTQNQWDNLQQLGQETQNQWDNLQQLGQQSQDNLGKLEDFSQQTHKDPEQHVNGKLEDLSQPSPVEDILTNFEQQTNSENQNLEDFSQHTGIEDSLTNFEQQANSQNQNLEDFSQHTGIENSLTNFEQQANSQNQNLEDFSQHTGIEDSLTNFEQQANSQNQNLKEFSQHTEPEGSLTNFEQQSSSQNKFFGEFSQHTQTDGLLTNFEQQASSHNQNIGDLSQHTRKEDSLTNFEQVNNQNEKLYHLNNREQIAGFETQSNISPNADFVSQQFSAVNNQNSNNRNLFDQNQENIWYQNNANTDSYGFMSQSPEKLYQHLEEQYITGNDKQLDNNRYNNFFHQNNEDINNWNTNFNNPFENSDPSASFSTSDQGNPLQDLWNKIDNIAGEVTATEANNVNDKELFSRDYYSPNQKINPNYVPMNQSVDLTNTHINRELKDDNLNQNNLFNEQTQGTESTDNMLGHDLFYEQTQNTSTTPLPTVLSNYSPKPLENASKPINTRDEQSTDKNQNILSQEEGRGDIGSDETPYEIINTDKKYEIEQNIDTLSLAKEANIQKEDNVINQQNSIKKDESTNNEYLHTNISEQEKIHGLLNTAQPNLTSTIPTVETSTTLKSNTNISKEQAQHNQTISVVSNNNNHLPDLQKQISHQKTVESMEIPEDIQQQYADFSQLQGSQNLGINFQQGYDQQNTQQQFDDYHQLQGISQQNTLQDFGQLTRRSLQSLNNEKVQGDISKYTDTVILSTTNKYEQQFQPTPYAIDSIRNTPQIMEPKDVSSKIDTSIGASSKTKILPDNQNVDISKPENINSVTETIAEKRSLWTSVGNLFTKTKNKVVSWFSGS